jgi:hypothetical protein
MSKPRKQPPLHQHARRKGLTQHDRHELQLFRDFLRLRSTNVAPQNAYDQIYGESPPNTPKQDPWSKGSPAEPLTPDWKR